MAFEKAANQVHPHTVGNAATELAMPGPASSSTPDATRAVAPKGNGQVVLTLSRTLPGCKRTRMLAVEGASGVRGEPLHEMDSIQRALTQVRGIHPPPIMIIDGQTYPCVIEGSPRSPRLMMEDKGEKVRLYLEAGTVVWVIDPDFRRVSVHRPGRPVETLHETQELSGEPELPGFRVRVADLFTS